MVNVGMERQGGEKNVSRIFLWMNFNMNYLRMNTFLNGSCVHFFYATTSLFAAFLLISCLGRVNEEIPS